MRGGNLDRRIDLYHRVLTQDEQGQQVKSWPTPYATVWAEKRDVAGREFASSEIMRLQIQARFRIRWRTDVQATDRIAYDGKTYDIQHIAEIGRRQGLELSAVTVAT